MVRDSPAFAQERNGGRGKFYVFFGVPERGSVGERGRGRKKGERGFSPT